MPEISVIVPVYNAEQYLSRCVDSILKQTFTDFELILVNDGSKDGCGAICDEYCLNDSRIRVIHKENGGVSSARNAGLAIATGNWISFVDSDDYIHESHLQNLYQPEYDLAITGHICCDVDFGTRKEVTLPPIACIKADKQITANTIDRYGRAAFSYCWGKLFRRKLILSQNLQFDSQYALGEDTLFSIEYLSICQSFILLDSCSYVYMHRSSSSLSTAYDEDYFRTLHAVSIKLLEITQQNFGVDFPVKTAHELKIMYSQAINMTAGNKSLTFLEKYSAFRFFFGNRYLREAIDEAHIYFSGTSRAYRMVLRLKCPFLMLLALMIMVRIKSNPKISQETDI